MVLVPRQHRQQQSRNAQVTFAADRGPKFKCLLVLVGMIRSSMARLEVPAFLLRGLFGGCG